MLFNDVTSGSDEERTTMNISSDSNAMSLMIVMLEHNIVPLIEEFENVKVRFPISTKSSPAKKIDKL